jgi:hypothetical protein
MPVLAIIDMGFLSFGKKYKCEKCGAKFKTENELAEHKGKEHK